MTGTTSVSVETRVENIFAALYEVASTQEILNGLADYNEELNASNKPVADFLRTAGEQVATVEAQI